MSCYLLCEGLMLCRGAIYLSTDYSFASLCIMYVWLNLLRRVLRLKWLHALMFPLLNTASRPLSTCFRSNYFDFVFPCIRFRFPDRALPFPHKNMKTKVVRVFSRCFRPLSSLYGCMDMFKQTTLLVKRRRRCGSVRASPSISQRLSSIWTSTSIIQRQLAKKK